MSIIDPSAPAQEVLNAVLRIKQNNLDFWNEINTTHKRIFNMVWYDKDLSAKQIVDGFGTDAKDLFVFSGNVQEFLALINPKYVPLIPPKKYTINADGTVTVEE